MSLSNVSQVQRNQKQLQLAKSLFFIAAFLSFTFSITLYFYVGNKQAGIYVGLWVPSILSAGTLLLSGGIHGR